MLLKNYKKDIKIYAEVWRKMDERYIIFQDIKTWIAQTKNERIVICSKKLALVIAS